MFMLATHAEIQRKLHCTLLEALPDSSKPIAPYAELSQIPLLRACIDETFRLLPPVRFGLPRRTVGEGATICGEFIPGGVTVSSSVYTLHRDSSLFHAPLEWKPERWVPENPEVSEAERRNLKDYVLPFTLGGRACIGRNLAYMELSVCLAALVMSFEWTLTKEAKEGFTHYERFNSSPVQLMISAKARPEMLERLQ
jgi:benzoate 4-monooxygenase